MKKLNIFLVVAVIAASVLSSCNSNSTKMPSLKNQIDSLNYAFGLANGNGIKQYYLAADSANADSLNAKIESLLRGMDEGMKGDVAENPELAELGTNIGNALKEQKTAGLMGDSSLTVDIKLIKQGLVNGMKGSNIQMTAEEAQTYLNATMQKLQEKRMQEQNGPNKAAGEVFLKENAKKAGVVTTASGLQYEVIKKGTGALPNDSSRVKVHYHGTLIDGTVFDSSVDQFIFGTIKCSITLSAYISSCILVVK